MVFGYRAARCSDRCYFYRLCSNEATLKQLY